VRSGFITPYQNNLIQKSYRKREIQNKINEFNHKNFSLGNLFKSENLNKNFINENLSGFNLHFIATNPKKNVDTINTIKNINIDNLEIKENYMKENIHQNVSNRNNNNKKSLNQDNNNNLDILDILDNANENNKILTNNNNHHSYKNSINDSSNFKNSKEKEKERERRKSITILENSDREKLMKCVLNKLPLEEKVNLLKKRKKESIKIELSCKDSTSSLSNKDKLFLSNENDYINELCNREDLCYIHNLLKTKKHFEEKEHLISLSPNFKIKKEIKNIKMKKNKIEKQGIFLSIPYENSKRKFDNMDLNLEREKLLNKELSENQNKLLAQKNFKSKDINNNKSKEAIKYNETNETYENYFSNIDNYEKDDEKINNKKTINIPNDPNNKTSRTKDFEEKKKSENNVKEDSNIKTFILEEILKENKNELNSSNKFFYSGKCNNHILGAGYKNKLKDNKNEINEVKKIINFNQIPPNYLGAENENCKYDLSKLNSNINSPYSKNSGDDSDSYKFSNQNSFELENNIIDLKSKYRRDNKNNVLPTFEKGRIENDKINIKNFINTNLNERISKKMYISEIKNVKINQTLNENIFHDVKKSIINLNNVLEEDLDIKANYNKKNLVNYNKNNNNQMNPSTKKLIIKNRSVTPSIIVNSKINQDMMMNTIDNIYDISKIQLSKNDFLKVKNNENNNGFFLTNYQGCGNEKIIITTSTNENNQITYNFKIKDLRNTPSNKLDKIPILNISSKVSGGKIKAKSNYRQKFNSNEINLMKPEEKKDIVFIETNNNIPSAQNTSNSKILKSKKRIYYPRESPFKNAKLRRIFSKRKISKDLSNINTETNEEFSITKITTRDPSMKNKKVIINFDYKSNIRKKKSPQLKKENTSENNVIKSVNKSITNKNVNINGINISATIKENILENNKERNSVLDSSRISNDSIPSRSNSNKIISRSNSIKNIQEKNLNFSNKKESIREKNPATNLSNMEKPKYFLNRNIMEEYEKIKGQNRKSSDNKIIYSELRYKLDIIQENKQNYKNRLNEELINGSVDNNIILPKI